MNKQRFAFLGLTLGLALLGVACEDKTEVNIPPEEPPPIAVSVVPAQAQINVGQAVQLVAVVTGGTATTARTVTWASSSNAIATVSAAGLVTGVSAGIATITATSTADANARGAAAITVVVPPPPPRPTVSIKSITVFSTIIPVALNNVFGQIDVTLNLDVPTGARISALVTRIVGPVNVEVCRQTFSSGAEAGVGGDEVQGNVDIICSINTGAFTGVAGTDAAATVTFRNRPGYRVRAEIIEPGGTIAAEVQSADMTFNNINFIRSELTAPATCLIGALHSSGARRWCGGATSPDAGSITARHLPVLYNIDPANAADPNRVTSITLTSIPVFPPAPAPSPASFAAIAVTDAVAGFITTIVTPAYESNVALTVTSLTIGGQPGPACINPDPVLNPAPICGIATPNIWVLGTGNLPTGAFLVDNVAPWITTFNVTPAALCPGSLSPTCYLGPAHIAGIGTLVPQSGAVFYTHVDGGVSAPLGWLCPGCLAGPAPTVAFAAGVAAAERAIATGASVSTGLSAASGGPGESVTSAAYVFRAAPSDGLANVRTRWASTAAGVTNTTATAASNQLFGYDETIPTHAHGAFVLGTSSNPLDATVNPYGPPPFGGFPINATITFLDAGVGPSGFLGPTQGPVMARMELWNALSTPLPAVTTPTACFTPAGAATSCTTVGHVTDPAALGGYRAAAGGAITYPPTPPPTNEGYHRLQVFARDQAHNVSPTTGRFVLLDFTAPFFTGGLVAPTTIIGGAAVTFTGLVSDAVDLGSINPYVGYNSAFGAPPAGGFPAFLSYADKNIGTFTFSSIAASDPGSVTDAAFIRSVQSNTGAGLPSGTINGATSLNYAVRDMAGHQIRYVASPWGAGTVYVPPNDGVCPAAVEPDAGTAVQNCSTRQLNISPNAAAPVAGVFPQAFDAPGGPGPVNPAYNCTVALSNCDLPGLNGANPLHGLFTMPAPAVATICNNAALSLCPAGTPTTVALAATITGPVSTYTSPFSEVRFYYSSAAVEGGKWFFIGSTSAGAITDNTVTSTRTITYGVVWDAKLPKVRPADAGGPGTAYTIMAVGRRATGDALFSTTVAVTVDGN